MFTVYEYLNAFAFSLLMGVFAFRLLDSVKNNYPRSLHLFYNMELDIINLQQFKVLPGDTVGYRDNQLIQPYGVKLYNVRQVSSKPKSTLPTAGIPGTGTEISYSTDDHALDAVRYAMHTHASSGNVGVIVPLATHEALHSFSKIFADRLYAAAEVDLAYCRYNLLVHDLKATGNLVIYQHEAYGTKPGGLFAREVIGWVGEHGPYNLCTFLTSELIPGHGNIKSGLTILRDMLWFQAHQEKIGPVTRSVEHYYVGIGLMAPETSKAGEILLPVQLKLTPGEVEELVIYVDQAMIGLEGDIQRLQLRDDVRPIIWRRLVLSGLKAFREALSEAHDKVARG